MEIRKIKKEEVLEFQRVFAQVLREAFPEYSRPIINFFVHKDFADAFLKKPIEKWDYVVLAAKEKGKMIGFLVMEKIYAGVSFCTWLGVLKQYRGLGVGKRLVAAWEKEVLTESGHELSLVTSSTEPNKFYLGLGFKQEGFKEKAWFGLDYWVFGKIIGKPRPEAFLKAVPRRVKEKR